MGYRLGDIRPGSLSTRVLHHLRQAEAPVTRQALGRAFSKERHQIGRALDRLVVGGFACEDEQGRFAPGCGANYKPKPVEAHHDLSVGPALIAQIARIVDRAHAYRRAGAPSMSVLLLERAAAKRLPEYIRQDLLGLASLFAHHRELPATVDPRVVTA